MEVISTSRDLQTLDKKLLSADANIASIAKIVGEYQESGLQSNPDAFLTSLLVEAKLRLISFMMT
jgi:hypothetical protein